MKTLFFTVFALVAVAVFTGCANITRTQYIPQGTRAEAVAGFSQDDIDDVISRAVQSVLWQDRIKLLPGANRAVLIIPDVTNDTLSRGRDCNALAENLGISLREELTNSGKVVVYNKEVGATAQVDVSIQYILKGSLKQRNLRTDYGDFQIEYSLNLTLVELATGLEFWQKRIPIRKLADRRNLM